MAVVLVTGMSGVGKSAALAELARRGHRVVDTDVGDWSVEVPAAHGSGVEQLWREERMQALLSEPVAGSLFVSGCVANQSKFSGQFAAIVLLSVPHDVLVRRVATRETNEFGKTEAQLARILNDLRTVEPLLRAAATDEVDTRRPVAEVADRLEAIASRSPDS